MSRIYSAAEQHAGRAALAERVRLATEARTAEQDQRDAKDREERLREVTRSLTRRQRRAAKRQREANA